MARHVSCGLWRGRLVPAAVIGSSLGVGHIAGMVLLCLVGAVCVPMDGPAKMPRASLQHLAPAGHGSVPTYCPCGVMFGEDVRGPLPVGWRRWQ